MGTNYLIWETLPIHFIHRTEIPPAIQHFRFLRRNTMMYAISPGGGELQVTMAVCHPKDHYDKFVGREMCRYLAGEKRYISFDKSAAGLFMRECNFISGGSDIDISWLDLSKKMRMAFLDWVTVVLLRNRFKGANWPLSAKEMTWVDLQSAIPYKRICTILIPMVYQSGVKEKGSYRV